MASEGSAWAGSSTQPAPAEPPLVAPLRVFDCLFSKQIAFCDGEYIFGWRCQVVIFKHVNVDEYIVWLGAANREIIKRKAGWRDFHCIRINVKFLCHREIGFFCGCGWNWGRALATAASQKLCKNFMPKEEMKTVHANKVYRSCIGRRGAFPCGPSAAPRRWLLE